jgi:hypothetical protein
MAATKESVTISGSTTMTVDAATQPAVAAVAISTATPTTATSGSLSVPPPLVATRHTSGGATTAAVPHPGAAAAGLWYVQHFGGAERAPWTEFIVLLQQQFPNVDSDLLMVSSTFTCCRSTIIKPGFDEFLLMINSELCFGVHKYEMVAPGLFLWINGMHLSIVLVHLIN